MRIRRAASALVLASCLTPPLAAQAPAGGEFLVNTYTTGRQSNSHPAIEPDGDFVVVWSSEQDGSFSGIFGQRFAASGAPRGAEFQVNTYTTGWQSLPAVAVGSGGDFVVAWTSFQDGHGTGVQAGRFDGAGNPIGGEFQVNTITTYDQWRPKVGQAADGRFVVSWDSHFGVMARRFDPAGNPVGGDFLVPTTYDPFQRGDLAVDPSGSFVLVWDIPYGDADGSGGAIFGQRFDAAGNRQGGEFRVNSYTTGNQRLPSVSISPVGGFVSTWGSEFGDGSGWGVFARRFDAAGSPVGNDFVVNTYTTGNQYSFRGTTVAHDAVGDFVVTWPGPGDGSEKGVFAQRFDASGARRGGEFRVNTYTTGDQHYPSIVSDPAGNFLVTWTSTGQDGSDAGVFARRSQDIGFQPEALLIDPSPTAASNGNGVLEPGEEVVVQPSWHNQTAATHTLTGAIDRPSGPIGATYLITDATASYSPIAAGATGSCFDCYAFFVSDPPVRPSVHWDAAVIETTSPVVGEKEWILHVGRSFTDVPVSSAFYRFVETLLHRGVTTGCSPAEYCPSAATTREQMAVFVLVAKEGTAYAPPPCTIPVFEDVPATSPFCPWVEELARRSVVVGCDGIHFCPSDPVTREQMAVFVLRTMDTSFLPPFCTTPVYDDVPATSGFCRWIEELTRRGVVTGCGGGDYCPVAPVSREQMGVFISVTFGFTLYGP